MLFLLYLYYAKIVENNDSEKYLVYLRKALQAFPKMKQGIEILLNEVRVTTNKKQDDFENYRVQVKASINQLISNGQIDEAKQILKEYKSIVPNDMETILLESKILLN